MTRLDRRRFLTIAAAAAASPALATTAPVRWTGQALGASVSMQLSGLDARDAAPILARVEAELVRLERIFSLYRPESELFRLNRNGRLDAPSPELLEVLSLSDRLHDASAGAFDPTVQPLWLALAKEAPAAERSRARAAVGWDRVRFDARSVEVPRGGGMTLNGIAQGAITDRISTLLRAEGLRDVLVDMGEIAALGHRPDGKSWLVGIAAPSGTIVQRLRLSDRALATSAPEMMQIGDLGHILTPDGHRARNALVSVSAPSAAVADGLSTALCLVGAETADAVTAGFPGARVEVLRPA